MSEVTNELIEKTIEILKKYDGKIKYNLWARTKEGKSIKVKGG